MVCTEYARFGQCSKLDDCPFKASHVGGPTPCPAHFTEGKKCRFGDRCFKSHNPDHWKKYGPGGSHAKEKGTYCKTFQATGACPNGDDCHLKDTHVKLEEFQTCLICKEPYDIFKKPKLPRTLKCTHCLCTACIEELVKHSHKTEIRENQNGDLCNIIRATYGVIKCPYSGCRKTDCSKGLPPHSYQLLEVIGQEAYKTRLGLYYNLLRLIKEEEDVKSGKKPAPVRRPQGPRLQEPEGTRVFVKDLHGKQ